MLKSVFLSLATASVRNPVKRTSILALNRELNMILTVGLDVSSYCGRVGIFQ